MKMAHITFGGFLLIILFCGMECDSRFRTATRPVAAIAGTAHSEKPSEETNALLFVGVADLLKSKGFQGFEERQPNGHTLTWHPIYGTSFTDHSNMVCTVEIWPKFINVNFREYESQPHSNVFTTTDEQRETARTLAREIEIYLRTNLPASYEIHISTNLKPNDDVAHSTP
jgi:hypothetical protein